MSDLDARYGRRGGRRGLGIALAVAGILAIVAWAAWAGFRPARPNGVLYGYRVVDAHHVQVTLIVHRPDAKPATCTVYAQAEDHSTVGERPVLVPAGGPEERRIRAVITTERRAVNGVLRGCELAGG